ncbi:MAG: class I SAM-dependent methyltransferase [Spirochaetota bacterium]
MKLYTELAEYYYEIEKAGRNFTEEIQLIDGVFKKLKIHSVTDLGCGTGEHIFALHELGYKVQGVDASSGMVAVAENRFPACQFIHAKIQDYISPQPQDAMMCLFGSINYLIEEDELDIAFSNICQSLRPGGIFFLEVWNAFPIQEIKRKPLSNVSVSQIGKTLIQRNRGFRLQENNTKESLVEVNFVYNLNGKKIQDKHIMRVFYPEEIMEILQRNQLEVVATYGDYQKSPFKKNNGRMIVICRANLRRENL